MKDVSLMREFVWFWYWFKPDNDRDKDTFVFLGCFLGSDKFGTGLD